MIGKKILIALIYPILVAETAFSLSVTSSVDKTTVALGDPITLSVSVSGRGGSTPNPILPDLSNFEVYSSGTNTRVSMENGRFTSTVDLTYVLVPKKIGVLAIGPVVVKQKGASASSNSIKITVTKPGAINQAPQAGRQSRSTNIPRKTGNFFIDQTVNKRSPYVGEQVTLIFRFYQAENLWEQPTLEWPEFSGFTVEDLPPNTRSYEVVNGKQYRVTEIKRALFPITSGDITIESPRLTIKQDVFDNFMDPFNMFGRGRRPNRPTGPRVLTADPIKLKVRALPAQGKPADFAGAVGDYRIKVSIDKDSVGVDEPITMKVTLSGSGNIKSVPAISIPEMNDFRVYESGKTESINNTGGVVSGSKTFEQAVIPATSGKFTIPPVEFSFFDPNKRMYRTIQTRPIAVVASGEALADIAGTPKNIIGAGQKSFAYLITDFSAPSNISDVYKYSWFWILQFVPLAGMITALIFRVRTRKMLGDRAYARRSSASRKSRAIFKEALRRKKSGELEGFYAELYSSLVGFIADRLDLEKSAMTIDEIGSLEAIQDGLKDDLVNFLNFCHDARFAPGTNSASNMDDAEKKASNLIKRLEKVL